MLSFLFWNLNGKGPAGRSEAMQMRMRRIAGHFDVDVLILAESSYDPAELAEWLTLGGVGTYWHSASECGRIQIITRLPPNAMPRQFDSVDDRLTMRRLELARSKLLLVAIHMQSQQHYDVQDLLLFATRALNDIASFEKSENNYNTIVVGDMNMNPFDHGMVAADAFHGVMTKEIARRKERIVASRTFRFFYNPMWSLFGDRSEGPPGTFYRPPSNPIEYHWNMFDQILLRPELMDSLAELRILDDDGGASLLNQSGRPDVGSGSDHLPILFRLQVE